MNDLSGVRIGRYEVIRMIGSGGMACVYLAYDTVLKQIKILRIQEQPLNKSIVINYPIKRGITLSEDIKSPLF